jgi:hypothetical protein
MTPAYFSQYAEFFALQRSGTGVLTLRFHTDGGPVTFTGPRHGLFRVSSMTSPWTATIRSSSLPARATVS